MRDIIGSRHPRLATVLSLVAGLSLGCADEQEKGQEDNPLDDTKADSFFSPTEHGELNFGAANQAVISDEEVFHSWTFTLTGEAQVSLRTEISTNLDTVMYLYKREQGSAASWGEFFRKNDDHDDQLWSQIDFNGEPGEYRIKVKGFKSSHRGPFAVIGECSGDGCPTAGLCEADEFDALPGETSFTQGCADSLIALLSAPIASEASEGADEDQACSLSAAGKLGVDRLRAYWDDVVGWEDFKDGTSLSFEVDHQHHETGTRTTVDTDIFDEDMVSLWSDADGRLLALYQHNQSPDQRWFCGKSGEASMAGPGCFEDMFRSLTHKADAIEVADNKVTDCNSAQNDLPALVGDPVCEFASAKGLADDAPITVDFSRWRSSDGLLGAEVSLSAGQHQATYHLGTTFADHTVIFAITEDGSSQLPCLELM